MISLLNVLAFGAPTAVTLVAAYLLTRRGSPPPTRQAGDAAEPVERPD